MRPLWVLSLFSASHFFFLFFLAIPFLSSGDVSSERSMRLNLLLKKMEESLRCKYHQMFPKDPHKLYNYLQQNHIKKKLDELLKKKVLKQDQYDLLFPPNQNQTDSTKFDITLLALQLKTFCFKLSQGKKWNEWPDAIDQSEAAHLMRIIQTRNKIQHFTSISQIEFENILKDITSSLVAFGQDKLEIEKIKTYKLQNSTFSYK